MRLSRGNLDLLESKGLDIQKVRFMDGYRILKPNDVEGNYVEGYEKNIIGLVDGKLEITTVLNSPLSHIFKENGKYCFYIWECSPGPCPGDFYNQFDNIEDCLADVIDYYFGNPERMNEKREMVKARKDMEKRLQNYNEEDSNV